jgi:DNA-directed RNA polymerase subunit RPC12/RpoP
MPSETDEIRVRCPECGSTDIRERNVAYAELPVLSWARDDVTGELKPEDYDTDASADWEVEDVSLQYVCYRCRHRMRLSDLSAEPSDGTPPTSALQPSGGAA